MFIISMLLMFLLYVFVMYNAISVVICYLSGYISVLHHKLLSFTLFWNAASFGRVARTAMTIGAHRIVAAVVT